MVNCIEGHLDIINSRKDLKLINLDVNDSSIVYALDMDGFLHRTNRYNLVRGSKLSQKSVINKTAYYVNRLKKVHGNKYDYSKVEYTHKKAKLCIICPTHGEFYQIADDHKGGHGCPKCAFRERKGFTRTQWIKYCNKYNHLLNIIYVIKCYNNTEEFIKIGITSKTVKERFSGLFDIPYEYDILKEYIYTPEKAYDVEKGLHKKYIKYKYVPEQKFGGCKECFTVEILNNIKLK